MDLLLSITLIWSCCTYLHYNDKIQVSLLFQGLLSNQLEAGHSPIEVIFYGMVCQSMWEPQTRFQPLSIYLRLFSSVSPMAQGCKGEQQGTGLTIHPCCHCLTSSPLSTGILWLYYGSWVTSLLALSHSPRRGASRHSRLFFCYTLLVYITSLTWSSCLVLHTLGLVQWGRSSGAILCLVSG
jgi:hypothetical protein